MEELNRWSSAAIDIQSESQNEDIDLSGPLLLGGHVVKVLLFRAILRPFNALKSSTETTSSTDECRELEAYRLSRAGAKACVASFVAFTSNLKSSWIHGFWPFCTQHVASELFRLLIIRSRVHAGMVYTMQSCALASRNIREFRRGTGMPNSSRPRPESC